MCNVMYRKRVYSLTGKSKFFPRFPSDYHWGCGLSGWPYMEGISEPTFKCDDIVKYSNRPYIDDRTDGEKENYEKRIAKLNKEPPLIKEPSLNRIIYYRLVQLIPNDMPKSLSSFSRMRNSNSKNYQALVKKAEAAGFVFPETLEDVEKWEDNTPSLLEEPIQYKIEAVKGHSNLERDELFEDAVNIILETGQASVSMLQRRLKLGYARAAKLVDQIEKVGYIGPFIGTAPRKILITREQWNKLKCRD